MIYKGYKFYNKESEPGKNLQSIMKCPAFKAPTENILGFWDGETEQKEYFRSYRLVPQKPGGRAIYSLWNDPGERKNLIGYQSLSWVRDEVNKWMINELKDVPLPITSENNEQQMNFYLELMPGFKWKNHSTKIYE